MSGSDMYKLENILMPQKFVNSTTGFHSGLKVNLKVNMTSKFIRFQSIKCNDSKQINSKQNY